MNKGIGKILKESRISSGISVKEISDLLVNKGYKASESTIYSWENENSQPTPGAFLVMCDAYGIKNILTTFGYNGYKEDGSIQLNMKEVDMVEKYRFISTNSPDGASVVDTVLDREYSIAEKLKSQKYNEDSSTSSPAATSVIPMRFLSYYQRMASAGSGEFLFPDIPTEVIPVPDTPLSRRADFVIGVNGRSMEDTYFDGDKVLVEKTQDVPVGKIGIFIRGSECFIKEAGEDRLISHNIDKKQYPDIIPDERRIDAIGIVLGKVGE
ncbi:LexA family transcriptional regulator [Acetatifactor muris]|uniref:LexA family transcriptional regulator n=1 Tax=Acetatifactor muris TaxID=879566 RepID=UPI0023F26407|nr:XRE family transcriptional regulator [Acetatifactor muris]